MPSKLTSEGIGSGMTAHTRRSTRYDFTQPLAKEEVAEIKQWFASSKPRDVIEEARGLAERTLAAIEGGNTGPEDFKPYAGVGWYSREIIKRCDWLVEANRKCDARGGNFKRLTDLGYEIGVLITEARMKAAWDQDVQKAIDHEITRSRVNRTNRKADPEWRAQKVDEIRAETGWGVTNASREAAIRFPTKGVWTTFRDNYNARKVSDA